MNRHMKPREVVRRAGRIGDKVAKDIYFKYPLGVGIVSLVGIVSNEYLAPQYIAPFAEWAYIYMGEIGYPLMRWTERLTVDGFFIAGTLTAIKNTMKDDTRPLRIRAKSWAKKVLASGAAAATLLTATPYMASKIIEYREISSSTQRLLKDKKSLEARINGALMHRKIHEDAHKKAQEKNPLLKYYPDFTPNLTIAVEAIESGGKDQLSSELARGNMQFMQGTARLAGLRVDHIIDQRKNPKHSIDAAVEWLAKLTLEYRSAKLSATAYNGGQNRTRAFLRDDPQLNFWWSKSKYPEETQRYVPDVLAVKNMLDNPKKYELNLKQNEQRQACNQVYFPDKQTTINQIGKERKITESTLRKCNPEIKGQIVPKGYHVKYR